MKRLLSALFALTIVLQMIIIDSKGRHHIYSVHDLGAAVVIQDHTTGKQSTVINQGLWDDDSPIIFQPKPRTERRNRPLGYFNEDTWKFLGQDNEDDDE